MPEGDTQGDGRGGLGGEQFFEAGGAGGESGLVLESLDGPLGEVVGTGLRLHAFQGRQGRLEQVAELCGLGTCGQQVFRFRGVTVGRQAKRVIKQQLLLGVT